MNGEVGLEGGSPEEENEEDGVKVSLKVAMRQRTTLLVDGLYTSQDGESKA
jgi:hypothetical protein